MPAEWQTIPRGRLEGMFDGAFPQEVLESIERDTHWGSVSWDCLNAGNGMFILVCYGEPRHWLICRNGGAGVVFCPVTSAEVESIPGCPSTWEIPF